MSFKRKYRGKWYNGNGERIRNPRAYAFLLASLTARDYIIEGSLAILKELRLFDL